jgi:hypothetical protein
MLDMRRWLSIAAFCLCLFTLPLWAQRHGSISGGAHFAPHGGFSGHATGGHPSGAMQGAGFGHSSRSLGHGVHFRTGNGFHHHRGFSSRFAFYPYYPYAAYYPYAWYDSPFYSDREYEDQDSYADAPYRSPSDRASYSDDNGVQRDVQALSGKVDRLQANLEARNQPTVDKEPETALVFRDQHVEKVRNYAISGGMIWVFKEQAAKRIPLAQLDIPATVRMNDDRGVDFQVPEPALQIMIVR